MGRVGHLWCRLAGGALLLATGCQSSSGTHASLWPWSGQKTAMAEEYTAPPSGDNRYSDPPTFPKYAMQPKLKAPEPLDPQHGGGMGGSGRMGGPMGPSAAGAFQ